MLPILIALTALAASPRGGAENTLLVIDPTDPESVYVGQHYAQVRHLPPQQILYLDPAQSPYDDFADLVIPAVEGTLRNRRLGDRIDTVLIAPVDTYRIGDSGYPTDSCVNPNHMALSAAIHTIHQSALIRGGLRTSTPHNFYSSSGPTAFDGSEYYVFGSPSTDVNAQRYRIGAQLGYTGDRGNTVDEIIAMVDRSAAADGSRPAGTFYFQETGDSARSGPRHGLYPSVVSNIQANGGQAVHNCCAALPTGVHDVLGIMTGAASPAIASTDFTFMPGAFADHLTSFAAHFGTSSQTKMSEWIRKGASGTWGAVEEPCNWSGKFPRAQIHRDYFAGMNLGEAVARSVSYLPLQGMMMGDPLTRPWASLPEPELIDLPVGPIQGVLRPILSATNADPLETIDGVQAFIDGRPVWKTVPGQRMRVDTTTLADGWHELRVVAWNGAPLYASGRYTELIEVDNGPQDAVLALSGSGDWSSPITARISTSGATPVRAELHAGGRVVATTTDLTSTVDLFGRDLGAGDVDVVAMVWFDDGSRARTAPVSVSIQPDVGTPAGITPHAWDHTQSVSPTHPTVVELPISTDDAWGTLTVDVLTQPTQGSLLEVDPVPYRTYVPSPGATGTDSFTIAVTGPGGTSNTATITLELDPCIGLGPHLVAQSAPVAGQTVTFEARCATPGKAVYAGVSSQLGDPWLVRAFGVEIDLVSPLQLGAPRIADAQGRASWDVTIPAGATGEFWMQVVQQGAVGEPVLVTLLSP